MEDLYKSELWAKATPLQRQEFVAKIRAEKRIQREAEKKKLLEEKREKKERRPSVRPERPKKQKRKKRPVSPAVALDSFLETYEWRKLRMQALKKYGPKCMCCGATPATGAVMNVDHIKPRKLFPHLALELSNLQILCHECNHGKGNWDQTDWR